MKKVTALCLSLAFVVAFFCVPVNAATYTGSPAVHKSASGSGSGVTYEVILDQYYPEQNADSGIAAGEVYTMVYYRLTNSNDQSAYVRNTGFTIQWVTTPYIVRYETESDDLYLGYQNTSGSWYIYGDSPYSYNNGIVVAPHSSLYCVGYIVTSASVSGNTISSQTISSVSLSNHTITLGDYPYSPSGQQLEDITDILEDIKTQLIFTGSISSLSDVSYAVRNSTLDSLGCTVPTGFSGNVRIIRLSSFAASEEIVTSLTDVEYRHDCYIVPIMVTVYFNNNTGHAVQLDSPSFQLTNILDRTGYPTFAIYGFQSDLFDSPEIRYNSADHFMNMVMNVKYQYNGNAYIPVGTYRESFTVLCIFDAENSSYTINPSFTCTHVFSTSTLDISYNPIFPLDHMSSIIDQIYAYLTEQDQDLNDKADDVSDDASTVTEQIEYVHQQEMAFFEANEDAIEATGLSNFHYNQNTISAFTMITNQFASVWNALSDYTLVFIFTLLLSLATFIIRHEPTTKMKQYRTSVAAERAERISYYGRMNAQSRASARNDGDSYFWDAVRRNNM